MESIFENEEQKLLIFKNDKNGVSAFSAVNNFFLVCFQKYQISLVPQCQGNRNELPILTMEKLSYKLITNIGLSEESSAVHSARSFPREHHTVLRPCYWIEYCKKLFHNYSIRACTIVDTLSALTSCLLKQIWIKKICFVQPYDSCNSII